MPIARTRNTRPVASAAEELVLRKQKEDEQDHRDQHQAVEGSLDHNATRYAAPAHFCASTQIVGSIKLAGPSRQDVRGGGGGGFPGRARADPGLGAFRYRAGPPRRTERPQFARGSNPQARRARGDRAGVWVAAPFLNGGFLVLVAATFAGLVGVLDDVFDLRFWVKAAGHLPRSVSL